MRILITGGHGNIASMIVRNLSKYYDIVNPSHSELDLTDAPALTQFLDRSAPFDILIHTAVIGGRRTKSETGQIVFENLLMLENILQHSHKFKMILHFDSGAIYDRNTDILNRAEHELNTVPTDYYGFSKYVIYQRSLQYSHFFNLRVFNIFHANEEPDRFIQSCFIAKRSQREITIFKDKFFDFVYETDFIRIVKYYIDNVHRPDILEKTVNVCYDKKYKLSDIARIIFPDGQINIIDGVLDRNYCGSNENLSKMNIGSLDGLEKSLILYEHESRSLQG